MKKIICTLFLFVNIIYAKETITYDTSYLPNQSIEVKTTMENSSVVNISGNEDFIEDLKKQGKKFPLTIKQVALYKEQINTLNADKDNNIPINIMYKESNAFFDNGEKRIKMETSRDKYVGSIFNLNQDKNKKVQLKSIKSNTLNEEDKKLIFNIFKNLEKLSIEDKIFKVGDSFIDKQPINMPLQNGITMGLTQITEYKLIKIKEDIAYFETKSTFEIGMNSEIDKFEGEIDGYGFGEILYDFKNNLDKKTNMTINFNMTFKQGDIIFNSKTTNTSNIVKKLIKN